MKLLFSLLLLFLIGFYTHGQIGPWVQIPTPGTERILNLQTNGQNLSLDVSNDISNLGLNTSTLSTFNLISNNCLSTLYATVPIGDGSKIYSVLISDHNYIVEYDDQLNCALNFRIDERILNGSRFSYTHHHIANINNFIIKDIAIYHSTLFRIDSLALLIFNKTTHESEIIKFPSLGIVPYQVRSLDLEEGYFITINNTFRPYLLSFNPINKNFDTIAYMSNPGWIINCSKNKAYISHSSKVFRANSSLDWDEVSNGLPQNLRFRKIQTYEDTTLLISDQGFFTLDNNDNWQLKSWPSLLNTQKVVKANGQIYALATEQLYVLFNNSWQPVPMTGVIRGSSGSLYANDQYMFFSNRYLSFNNGQSWFDQQRYFNSTPQNSIGSIQTMRPEAWFSQNVSTNNFSVHRTTDQGTTWQTVDIRFLGNPTVNSLPVSRNTRWKNSDTLLATYGHNFLRLAISTDAGLSWRDDSDLFFQLPGGATSGLGRSCTIQAIGGNILFYHNSGKLYRTNSRSSRFEEVFDFGTQWQSLVSITGANDTVIVNMNPNNSPAPRKTLISTDGGRRFQEIRVPFPNQFASFALRRGQLWCANNGELSISNDLGRSFQRLYNPTDNFPFPNTAGGVATFNITDSMLFINGNHVAFYTRLPQGRVVSLAAEIQAPKEQLSLYPNPANERVFIKGLVKQENIRVFDLKGKEVLQGTIAPVESLKIEHLPSGLYMVVVGQQRLKVLKR